MIFVNYRQNHYPSQQPVRRAHAQLVEAIAARLTQHFGPDRVFLDTELRPASRYPNELRDKLDASELIIAVIHDDWLDDLNDRRARIGPHETDWVHIELATALKAGKHVLPVLIDSAGLPGKAELPDDTAELGMCQAHRIQFGHWQRDLTRLLQAAERHVSTEPLPREPEESPPPRRKWYAPATAGLVGLLAPYARTRLLLPDPGVQAVWSTALAIVLLGVLLFLLSLASVMYAIRKWVDVLDHEAAAMSHDQVTNVIVGLIIAGLMLMLLFAGNLLTPEQQLLVIALVTVLIISGGVRWLHERRGVEQWPKPTLGADPASIRGRWPG
jgi:hypothetical protein